MQLVHSEMNDAVGFRRPSVVTAPLPSNKAPAVYFPQPSIIASRVQRSIDHHLDQAGLNALCKSPPIGRAWQAASARLVYFRDLAQ